MRSVRENLPSNISQQTRFSAGSKHPSLCHTEHASHGSVPGYQDENGARGARAFEKLNC